MCYLKTDHSPLTKTCQEMYHRDHSSAQELLHAAPRSRTATGDDQLAIPNTHRLVLSH